MSPKKRTKTSTTKLPPSKKRRQEVEDNNATDSNPPATASTNPPAATDDNVDELSTLPEYFSFDDEEVMSFAQDGLLDFGINHYIITDSFKNLVGAINRGETLIVLLGPSGFGKSYSLLGLWYYYQYCNTGKFIPIILSPNSMSRTSVLETEEAIVTFTGRQTGKILVLIEMGRLYHRDAESSRNQYRLTFLKSLSKKGITVVFSYTSGGGYLLDMTLSVAKVQSALDYITRKAFLVKFEPFTKKNVKTLCDCLSIELPYTFKRLKFLTNYSPRMVMLCIEHQGPKAKLQQKISNSLFSYMVVIAESIKKCIATDPRMVLTSLKYLNCIETDVEVGDDFDDSFLAKENLLYIYEGKVCLNFPSEYYRLRRMLMHKDIVAVSLSCTSELWLKQSIKGQRFEMLLSDRILEKKLFLRESTGNNVNDVEVDVKQVQFNVLPLKFIEANTAYFLRPGHKAVDAVISTGNSVYLIQLSILKYRYHKSKSIDIGGISKPESKTQRIYEYYKEKSHCSRVVYTYISPQETGGDVTQLVPTLPSTRNSPANLDQSVSFAVVTPQSLTVQLLQELELEL